MKKGGEKPVAAKKELSNYHRKIQKKLSDMLDIKVEIKTSPSGKKGKLVLDFKNEEELEFILSHIK